MAPLFRVGKARPLPSGSPGLTIPPDHSPFDNRGSCDGGGREGRAGARPAGRADTTACGTAGSGPVGDPVYSFPGRPDRAHCHRARRHRGRMGGRRAGRPAGSRGHRLRPHESRSHGSASSSPRGGRQRPRDPGRAVCPQGRADHERGARVARGSRFRRRGGAPRHPARRGPGRPPHHPQLEPHAARRLPGAACPARPGHWLAACGRECAPPPARLPSALRDRSVVPSLNCRAGGPRPAQRRCGAVHRPSDAR